MSESANTENKAISFEDRDYIRRFYKKDPNKVLSEIKGKEFRKYREAWDAASTRQIKSDVPLQLGVELTSYCNLMCKMCYRNYKLNPKKENITLNLISELASQAKDLKIPAILLGSFTEALLHPQIKEILRIFAEVNAQDYFLITNGTRLTKDIAELLVDLPLDRLCISLDAATPKTYKIVRGADLNLVTSNIMQFLELRAKKNSKLPLLRLSFVELEDNIHEKEMFIEQWKDIADVIDFQKFQDLSGIAKDSIGKGTEGFLCTDPFKMIVVKHDGEILPCCHAYYEAENPAYLRDMRISEFWNSQYLCSLRESISKREYTEACAKCMNCIKEV